jgi:predicted RNase H-like HicB family nuclease
MNLITIFPDEDGMFIAECPSIPGCVSQGKTEQEVEENIQEAIKECLEVRAEKGMPSSTLLLIQPGDQPCPVQFTTFNHN